MAVGERRRAAVGHWRHGNVHFGSDSGPPITDPSGHQVIGIEPLGGAGRSGVPAFSGRNLPVGAAACSAWTERFPLGLANRNRGG
jgi:hypothetical protein